jgi:hypothetical protein
LNEPRYRFIDSCVVVAPGGLVYFKDDGQPRSRLLRGLYEARRREELDGAVAGGGVDACWIGLAQHEHGDHGLRRPTLARAVWVTIDSADFELQAALAAVPDASIAIGTIAGEPMQIGWLLASPERDPTRYETLSQSLAARVGSGFRATTMRDLVLLPGTSWLTRGGWHQLVYAAYGSDQLHWGQSLEQSCGGSSVRSGTALQATDEPDRSSPSVDTSGGDSENVRARAHEVEALAHAPTSSRCCERRSQQRATPARPT